MVKVYIKLNEDGRMLMKILIIGGTKFLGRHLTQIALERGHEVTLFNRGQTNPDLFPQAERLIGDRDGDLSQLAERHWDVCIDPSGYVPRIVRKSAQTLAKSIKHYTFISSISVYNDFSQSTIDETFDVAKLEDESIEEVTGESYGPLKALCEQEVLNSFPEGALIVRPGLIVGPYDPTDRFTYWPSRVVLGGEIIAPGDPNSSVQFIDVRDLALWILDMIENRVTGTYNVTGPDSLLTMGQFLEACSSVATDMGTPDIQLHWLEEEFLVEKQVGYWTEMPLWIPATMKGMLSADCSKAKQLGLSTRPITDTIRDTFLWDQSRDQAEERKAGLSREKEHRVLEEWKASVAPQ